MRWLIFPLFLFTHFSAVAESARPNILLIFSDDQGTHDVGCYGSEIPTPNMDRLAAEGIQFTQWYSASSICTPSRYGLLTGRNPSRSQDHLLGALMFMGDEDKGIRTHETTVAERLQTAGYDTALIGKWHLGHGSPSFLPTRHGFDHFIGHTAGCIDYFTMTYGLLPDWYHQEQHVSENGYATDLITEEAITYLGARKPNDSPFFLYLAYNAPHFGKGYSPSDQATVNLMQPQAAELKRVASIEDKIRREFAAMTVSLDDGIGRVLDALEASRLADNTLVIFLTDHGGDPVYGGSNRPLRGDKASLFDGGLLVPCLMRWPGKITPQTTSHQVFSSLDLAPTFCRIADIDLPAETFDGQDLLPFLTKQTPSPERTLFWELGAHDELDRGTWTAIRQGAWKYVRTPEQEEFLFDLTSDPIESQDRSADHPDRLQKLRDQCTQLSTQMHPTSKG